MSSTSIGVGLVLYFFGFIALGIWFGAANRRWYEALVGRGEVPALTSNGALGLPLTPRKVVELLPCARRPEADQNLEQRRLQMWRRFLLMGAYIVLGLLLPVTTFATARFVDLVWTEARGSAWLYLPFGLVLAFSLYDIGRKAWRFGNGEKLTRVDVLSALGRLLIVLVVLLWAPGVVLS